MCRVAVPLLAVLAAAGGVACGGDPTTGDFQDEAENFIEDDEGELATQLEDTFIDAQCAEPASTDVGTTYNCTATNAGGDTVEFVAEIAGETSIRVGLADATVAPAPSTPSSTPPTTAAG